MGDLIRFPARDVFGIPVSWGLPADCQPLEVIGCLKYLDERGDVQYWVFESETLHNVEATGMTTMQMVACRDEMEANIYENCTLDDDDDDDN